MFSDDVKALLEDAYEGEFKDAAKVEGKKDMEK